MRYITFLALIILAASFMAVIGCSKNKNDNPTGPDNSLSLPFPLTLNAPAQGMLYSGDTLAGSASNLLAMAKEYNSLFNPPANATDTTFGASGFDTTISTWRVNQLTMKLIFSQQLEVNTWSIIYNGTDAGHTYVNWNFADAEQSIDGSNGWMNKYLDSTTDIENRWEWLVENGKPVMNIYWVDQQDSVKFKAVLNSGTNGYAEYYLNNIIKWKVDWNGTNSSVSGMWYIYVNGNFSRSGSWAFSS